MAKRTWSRVPAEKAPVAVPVEVKAEVVTEADQVLTALRKRLKSEQAKCHPFSKPVAIDAHWHRNAFYFCVTYKSRVRQAIAPEHGVNVARIEYNADGTFTLGFPMRRGWTNTLENAELDECLEWVKDGVYL